MRTRYQWAAAVAALQVVLGGYGLRAQALQPCVGPVYTVSYGLTGRNIAYSATVKQSFEQRLADGNVVRHGTELIEAKDSADRTVRQRLEYCEKMQDGQIAPRYEWRVFDPKAGTELSWETGGHAGTIAVLHHVPSAPVERRNPPDRAPMQMVQPKPTEFSYEQLGSSTIAGQEAKGVRTIRTIPAGEEGNESPLQIVSERWEAANHVVVRWVEDDPRRGRTVTELENLMLQEPDPALFAPPTGYTVRDENPPPARSVPETAK